MVDGAVDHLAGRPTVLGEGLKFVAEDCVGALVQRPTLLVVTSMLDETIPLLIGNPLRSRKLRAP